MSTTFIGDRTLYDQSTIHSLCLSHQRLPVPPAV